MVFAEHKYQPNIHITRHHGNCVKTKKFNNEHYFSLKEEAIQYGVLHGRAIIDGKIEG
jgi:hypothetical protein